MGVSFLGLTTGPFIVPGKVSGDPDGSNPNDFFIVLKNPTNSPLEIQLFADICLEPNANEEEHFFTDIITIGADSCFTINGPIPLQSGFIVRISMVGDIRTKGLLLEGEVVGFRTVDFMNEPTMFFRHHDLFPTNNITMPGGLTSSKSTESQWKKI